MLEAQIKPLISVVMATYNTPLQNLQSAVRSVFAQDFTNFELIVVDDASEIPAEELIKVLSEPRLKVVRHERNQGSAAARNSAIEVARGQYVVLIDADDWVEPNYISTLYQAINESPEYSAISCRVREFSDDGSSGPIVGRVGEKGRKHIIRGDVPVHGASIIRRNDLIEIGGYPPYRRGQDYALWCEMILGRKRLKVIEPILYHYRVNLSDYRKRTLWNRRHSLYALIHYYPKLGATALDYRYVLKSVLAGLLPARCLKAISERKRSPS